MAKDDNPTIINSDITLFFIIFTTVFVPPTVETGKKPAEKIGLLPSKQANRGEQKKKETLDLQGFVLVAEKGVCPKYYSAII